tara:strand:+ start:4855 stop:5298 length:444 start_codon:yes stop_codon:yes gene_type:complete
MSKEFPHSAYVIVMVSFDGKTDSIAIDPLSIHTDLEKAMGYCAELESFSETNNFYLANHIEVTYDVLEFILDEPPILLTLLEKKRKVLEENVEETIINLMKQGVVDQLIGEDGHFYYKLTKEGRKKLKEMNISPLIRKILKRNDEED